MRTDILPRTLRARLTVLIVASSTAVLALSGFTLYEALRNRIEASATAEMDATMSALKAHLPQVRAIEEIPYLTETWIDMLHGHANLSLAIFDSADRRLLSTPGYRHEARVAATLERARLVPAPIVVQVPRVALRYLATAIPLATGENGVRVVVQYDANADRALLRTYACTIVLIQVCGVLIAACLAYGIALVGLSPLRRLVAQAEDMSTSRLAHPLPDLQGAGELQDLGRAFNGMLARLDESFTRLAQFSSNLAHDLRTPLTNLLAHAQVVLSRQRSAAEYREVIETSVDEYQRLSRMIDDMLFLARADSTQSAVTMRMFDAFAEASRVAGFYEPMAECASVAFDVRGAGVVYGNPLLFQRALSNLLSNALAHAPQGSTVDIHCLATGNGDTMLTVSDAGPGIEAAHRARIFERFYRTDPARHNLASGTGGAGLGLAIVRSIMQLHGGECGVESEPHVRTTFWLKFPACAQRAST
ncbi:heavy metal sensor histidine kinase [Paraburkholderia sp. SARCC-3016]|uniref:heavy metal sensor histidine kinase n=1 Tax=Paraburkholderia sp. SARCC-3016 TaxID=3058611 RepID=UPI0028069A04|nr:heavy metal sensor histidine kinase [Paraburkholderia sp. SARCC-3016]MDQ7982121.1 heavy metal sensor histidine kinase [Paraburkholderia sp. SARCC-3016]